MARMVFHQVARVGELADRSAMRARLDGKDVAVARVGERYFAVDALCSHMGLPLDRGSVDSETEEIVCPWHSARFCLKTGSRAAGPGLCDLAAYAVRVNDGFIEIGMRVEEQPEREAPLFDPASAPQIA